MAKLKFKNGSSWTEIPLGIGGTLDQQYPVGSFYMSPVAAIYPQAIGATPTATYNFESATSPATIYGGTWNAINKFYDSANYTVAAIVVNPSMGYTNVGDGGYSSYNLQSIYGIYKYSSGSNSYYNVYGESQLAANMIPKWTYGSVTATSSFSRSVNAIFVAKLWQRIA